MNVPPAQDRAPSGSLLKGLLFFQLFFVVNALHFPYLTTGIPAIAPANVIFVLVLLLMRDRDQLAGTGAMLRSPLLWFYGTLVFAFLWAQVRAPGGFIQDLTYLKNAMFYPLFYFIYLRCRQDLRTTRWLIIAVLAVAALAGLEAFREGLDYGFTSYNPARRAAGPFGNDYSVSNRAGVFFATFLPMFMALALFLRGQLLWRLAAIGGIFILVGGTLSTYSRQSYIIVVLGAGVLLLRKNIILGVFLGLALLTLSEYLPDSVTQRVEETTTVGKEGEVEVDVSTASRWKIWGGAMKMLAANPLGIGLRRFQREIGSYAEIKNVDAHNFYVLTISECGPQGLIAFVLVLWTLFRMGAFLRAHVPEGDTEAKALAVGFTISTLCMVIGGLYGSPMLEGSVMAPYWGLAGLLERYFKLKMQAADGAAPTARRAPSLAERFPLAAYTRPERRR